MNVIDGILLSLKDIIKRVNRLETQDVPRWVFLNAPLTSTSWDGDAHSTTAKTIIDLSAVFGAPAGIKAVLVYIYAADSGSAGADCYFGLSPNNTAGHFSIRCYLAGQVNDWAQVAQGICPCDANGDVYYQILATGANTLDVWMQFWGYLI